MTFVSSHQCFHPMPERGITITYFVEEDCSIVPRADFHCTEKDLLYPFWILCHDRVCLHLRGIPAI